MDEVSIKMYNKFDHVLRVESTYNEISTFRIKREVQHMDGTPCIWKAPLKKSIYNLYQLSIILKSTNCRYHEFISAFDNHSNSRKKLDDVSRSQKEKGLLVEDLTFLIPVTYLSLRQSAKENT